MRYLKLLEKFFIGFADHLRRWTGDDHFYLGGGSHGGVVALEYALNHGDRLKGMILRDTFAQGPNMMAHALDLSCRHREPK